MLVVQMCWEGGTIALGQVYYRKETWNGNGMQPFKVGDYIIGDVVLDPSGPIQVWLLYMQAMLYMQYICKQLSTSLCDYSAISVHVCGKVP